jgi:NTE family protein
MLFHLGVLWRLAETGWLFKLERISSVSGGSVTSALLALRWNEIKAANDKISAFKEQVVGPIMKLAAKTIDKPAILQGLALPGSISGRIAASYRKALYGSATLQDLPDHPRFVINATNIQSGVLWRFSKPYMADYRVGVFEHPDVELAIAVAASSAFPPVLAPLVLPLDASQLKPDPSADLQREPFISKAVLADGGVYDNLGLETVWKNYRTVLISDAGAKIMAEEAPKSDWARLSYRVFEQVDNQVRSLRKRQIMRGFFAEPGSDDYREGAYWSIRSDIGKFSADSLPCPLEATTRLAAVSTRLKALPNDLQCQLVNWGYAACDAGLRTHVDANLVKGRFPFPNEGVGQG